MFALEATHTQTRVCAHTRTPAAEADSLNNNICAAVLWLNLQSDNNNNNNIMLHEGRGLAAL